MYFKICTTDDGKTTCGDDNFGLDVHVSHCKQDIILQRKSNPMVDDDFLSLNIYTCTKTEHVKSKLRFNGSG